MWSPIPLAIMVFNATIVNLPNSGTTKVLDTKGELVGEIQNVKQKEWFQKHSGNKLKFK